MELGGGKWVGLRTEGKGKEGRNEGKKERKRERKSC
jgi:hypothetical protein